MKALEFYSGIGGMHYAFSSLFPDGTVVNAFDINEIANDVYQHNFGFRPKQGNIEKVSVAELTKYSADVWLMAPPCQPYTRQGLKKHSADGRARSFLRLLQMLKQLPCQPRYLLLENVVGFETSDTHDGMLELLAESGYNVQEFILTPSQYAIPYSRPRYFCLAKKSQFLADAPVAAPAEASGGAGEEPAAAEAAAGGAAAGVAAAAEANAAGDMEEGAAEAGTAAAVVAAAAAAAAEARTEEAGAAAGAAAPPGIWHCTPSFIMQCVAAGKEVRPSEEVPPTPEPVRSYLVADPAAEKVLLLKHEAAPALIPSKGPLHTGPCSTGSAPACSEASGGAPEGACTPSAGALACCERSSQGGREAPSGRAGGASAAGSTDEPPGGPCSSSSYANACKKPRTMVQEPAPAAAAPQPRCTHSSHDDACGGQDDAAARQLPASTSSGPPSPHHPTNPRPDPWALYRAHHKVLAQCADVIDVVSPDSRKSNCFTKSYTQYAKGTGSFLCALGAAQLAPHGLYITPKGNLAHRDPRVTKDELATLWESLGLRYFTAREAANLHGFPPGFSFPASVTLRQRYQLIGNSLSVVVVADLLRYLFAERGQ